MDARDAVLQVMAKMALSDGELAVEEREFLEEVAGEAAAVDRAIEAAGSRSLEELVSTVPTYEDRFFIALRAYSMAHVDQRFDVEEERLFRRLADILGIPPEDRRLIHRAELAVRAGASEPPDPRIEELFRRSSFAASC